MAGAAQGKNAEITCVEHSYHAYLAAASSTSLTSPQPAVFSARNDKCIEINYQPNDFIVDNWTDYRPMIVHDKSW
jgi:hypothetical protein